MNLGGINQVFRSSLKFKEYSRVEVYREFIKILGRSIASVFREKVLEKFIRGIQERN